MNELSKEVEVSRKIYGFHQFNYKKQETHQVISDPKSSYFQYSRYYSILNELDKFKFNNFIDVGCAEGMYLLAVYNLRRSCDIYGVDFSSAGLNKAKSFTNNLFALACTDAAHLPFLDKSFDLVLCSESLEHMVEDKKAIEELSRICRQTCVITVPSFNNQYSKRRFKPDVECKRDSHLRKYSLEELKSVLGQHFEEIQIYNLSMWYLSSADIILHMFAPKQISSKFSHMLSYFASLDYKLSKAGAHGHSFICICSTKKP